MWSDVQSDTKVSLRIYKVIHHRPLPRHQFEYAVSHGILSCTNTCNDSDTKATMRNSTDTKIPEPRLGPSVQDNSQLHEREKSAHLNPPSPTLVHILIHNPLHRIQELALVLCDDVDIRYTHRDTSAAVHIGVLSACTHLLVLGKRSSSPSLRRIMRNSIAAGCTAVRPNTAIRQPPSIEAPTPN